jgi:hypothetical protein
MNVCPSFKNLVTKEAIEAYTDQDNNISDKFDLIDDERTVFLKYIKANTALPFSVQMLSCYKWKEQSQNYCDTLYNPQAINKLCEINKTNYIFFYIRRWYENPSENKLNDIRMYILAFVRYSKDEKNYQDIINEIKRTSKWLSISGSAIKCYIFYYAINFLSDISDIGTFKKKYSDLCPEKGYNFQIRFVLSNKKPKYLSIYGGDPQFKIKVQEV